MTTKLSDSEDWQIHSESEFQTPVFSGETFVLLTIFGPLKVIRNRGLTDFIIPFVALGRLKNLISLIIICFPFLRFLVSSSVMVHKLLRLKNLAKKGVTKTCLFYVFLTSRNSMISSK